MQRLISLALLAFGFVSSFGVADAQLIINGTTVLDASGTATGNTPTLIEGQNVNVTNQFPISITLRVKNEEGQLVGELGLLAGDRFNGPHGLSAGTYTLCVAPAGSDSDNFLEVGRMEVVPATDGSLAFSMPRRTGFEYPGAAGGFLESERLGAVA